MTNWPQRTPASCLRVYLFPGRADQTARRLPTRHQLGKKSTHRSGKSSRHLNSSLQDGRLDAEVSFQNAELSNKIHKLDSRIDTEISNMKAIFEAFKADSIKYLAGTVMSVLVVILGALRLIMWWDLLAPLSDNFPLWIRIWFGFSPTRILSIHQS